MRRIFKILFFIFLLVISNSTYSQDSITFKIRKQIYATATGQTSGRVDRDALVDSGGIVIHNCSDCRVLGFDLRGKINQNSLSGNSLHDSTSTAQSDSLLLINSEMTSIQRDDNGIMSSGSAAFSYDMIHFIRIKNKVYRTYYIEIFNIKVVTSNGEEKTLDKICLFLN